MLLSETKVTTFYVLQKKLRSFHSSNTSKTSRKPSSVPLFNRLHVDSQTSRPQCWRKCIALHYDSLILFRQEPAVSDLILFKAYSHRCFTQTACPFHHISKNVWNSNVWTWNTSNTLHFVWILFYWLDSDKKRSLEWDCWTMESTIVPLQVIEE